LSLYVFTLPTIDKGHLNSLNQALFSTSRGRLPDYAGQGFFSWLVVVLMLITFTLASLLGKLTSLFNFLRNLGARIARPVAQPTVHVVTRILNSINKTDHYKRFKDW
jgi:hypothetical protein